MTLVTLIIGCFLGVLGGFVWGFLVGIDYDN